MADDDGDVGGEVFWWALHIWKKIFGSIFCIWKWICFLWATFHFDQLILPSWDRSCGKIPSDTWCKCMASARCACAYEMSGCTSTKINID